jgi:hypothetical protein
MSAGTDWVAAASRAASRRDRDLEASAFAAEAARRERTDGAAARAAFVRATLAALVAEHEPRISAQHVPDTVKRLIQREYARIDKGLTSAPDADYDLARHSMRSDFRIVAFGRIPMGVEHIEMGGVPRSLLWKGGAAQSLRVARALLAAGGAAPFYSAHLTHGIKPWAFLMAYTAHAQAAWHRNVAECLRMNPRVRGLIASSWLYDPALVRVAPHLVFLREGSLAHGAILATRGPTEGSRAFAVANSPERAKLVESGAYRPASFSVIFTRDALLRWADSGV